MSRYLLRHRDERKEFVKQIHRSERRNDRGDCKPQQTSSSRLPREDEKRLFVRNGRNADPKIRVNHVRRSSEEELVKAICSRLVGQVLA